MASRKSKKSADVMNPPEMQLFGHIVDGTGDHQRHKLITDETGDSHVVCGYDGPASVEGEKGVEYTNCPRCYPPVDADGNEETRYPVIDEEGNPVLPVQASFDDVDNKDRSTIEKLASGIETGEVVDIDEPEPETEPEAETEPEPEEKAVTPYVAPMPVIDSAFEVSPTGLTVKKKLTVKQYVQAMRGLQGVAGATNWWIGDALNWGEKTHGEKYAQAIDESEAKTWTNYAWVAGSYKPEQRIANLSWSHHKEVAAIAEPRRSQLLRAAATASPQWSVSKLKAEAKSGDDDDNDGGGSSLSQFIILGNDLDGEVSKIAERADGRWTVTLLLNEDVEVMDGIREQLSNLETTHVLVALKTERPTEVDDEDDEDIPA